MNSGGRKRNISADHVRWVMIGACSPPVRRRCSAKSTPITTDASTGGIQAPLLTHLTWSVLMLRFLPPLFRRRLR